MKKLKVVIALSVCLFFAQVAEAENGELGRTSSARSRISITIPEKIIIKDITGNSKQPIQATPSYANSKGLGVEVESFIVTDKSNKSKKIVLLIPKA